MKKLLPTLTAVLALTSVHATTIAIIGDSTVSDYKTDTTAMRGWGQLLPEFLEPGVTVMNEALSGMSTKTFPRERWQKILEARPEFVLIQFGHNDSHAGDRPESTDAATDFRDNLRRYIREAREAGIQPILVTPMRRRVFKEGRLRQPGILFPYAEAMREVARESSVPLVDLHQSSTLLLEALGEDASEGFTMNDNERHGKKGSDRTHFTETGAREMARLVARDLRGLNPTLEALVKKEE